MSSSNRTPINPGRTHPTKKTQNTYCLTREIKARQTNGHFSYESKGIEQILNERIRCRNRLKESDPEKAENLAATFPCSISYFCRKTRSVFGLFQIFMGFS